jgi:hypothetical protein
LKWPTCMTDYPHWPMASSTFFKGMNYSFLQDSYQIRYPLNR